MSLLTKTFLSSFRPIFVRTVQTSSKDKKIESSNKNDETFLNDEIGEHDDKADTELSTGRERSLNRIQLIGRVGADPKVGGTQRNKVVTFNLATNEYAGTSTENGEVKQRVDWHRIAVFQPRLLDNAEKYIRQGDRIYVQGRLHHNMIRDKKTGQDRYVANERINITIPQSAQNIPVDRIDSSYTINIEENRSTLKDGVYIRLHTDIHCQLRAFWFVNIQRFYKELDSRDFRLSLYDNRFLKDNCVHQETFNFETSGDYVQRIEFSDAENYLINNNETRREYPLVLIVHSLITENSEEFFQLPIQVATLHVKSSIPTDPPTKFILRISKLADGRSLVLQDIFTPGAFHSDNTCAVCLTEPVTHVLLPCKHACVCRNCFSLIDKCPVCLVQCRSVFTDTVDRDKRSLNNVNYSNLCMFRKSRLCNHLRELSMGKSDQTGNDQELWKRGVSHFYSNW
ncbi:unnamed protein product [Adineta steineri]|uniref:RING-type domain-containing protein n=1 Tax=Adineta steineri TaxID=433720 RepID=A0A814JG14_9BILA|nr:unnamed protein product [Adineta steineri]CAF3496106.1 unnamed protein product [Adineta steineri]